MQSITYKIRNLEPGEVGIDHMLSLSADQLRSISSAIAADAITSDQCPGEITLLHVEIQVSCMIV